MSNIKDLTVAELKRAIEIREDIERLQDELAAIGGGTTVAVSVRKAGKRHMSAAGRARIAAAAKARWAKFRKGKGGTAAPKPTGKKKRFSAAARARLAAAARARWAKAKAAGKSTL